MKQADFLSASPQLLFVALAIVCICVAIYLSKHTFERYIAMRYLKSKRKEVFISIITIISILGVAVSVLVLNMVLAVMTGFERELQAKLINQNAHVVVRKYGGSMDDWQQVQKTAAGTPGVEAAFPYTYAQALISVGDRATGVLVRGLDDSAEPKAKLASILSKDVSVNSLYTPAKIDVIQPDGQPDVVELPPIVIGRELQNRLGLADGTSVTLMSPELSSSPMGLVPRTRQFMVVGTYSSGLSEYEAGLLYMSMPESQKFFSLGNAVTGIEIKLYDHLQASSVAQQINERLGGLKSPYYTTDWTQLNKDLWEALKLEKNVYFIVLQLLVLVASFSIVSTLVMVVMEKGKDIALLKTMGLSDRGVMRIFLIQGSIIGIVGTSLGSVLGYLGCIGLRHYGFPINQAVFSLDKVPVYIIPENFAVVALAGLFITALAGIYPAWRAARLKPAEALRFE